MYKIQIKIEPENSCRICIGDFSVKRFDVSDDLLVFIAGSNQKFKTPLEEAFEYIEKYYQNYEIEILKHKMFKNNTDLVECGTSECGQYDIMKTQADALKDKFESGEGMKERKVL